MVLFHCNKETALLNDVVENNTKLNLDIKLDQLEEAIEAEFEELNAKMSEFDFQEKATTLITTPETPRRRTRGRNRSDSDSDDYQIQMERHLEEGK